MVADSTVAATVMAVATMGAADTMVDGLLRMQSRIYGGRVGIYGRGTFGDSRGFAGGGARGGAVGGCAVEPAAGSTAAVPVATVVADTTKLASTSKLSPHQTAGSNPLPVFFSQSTSHRPRATNTQ